MALMNAKGTKLTSTWGFFPIFSRLSSVDKKLPCLDFVPPTCRPRESRFLLFVSYTACDGHLEQHIGLNCMQEGTGDPRKYWSC